MSHESSASPALAPIPSQEHQLLARHCAGDRRAFTELVEQFRGQVYGYLTRCGINPHARDDLAQEVFLKIHGAAESYRPLRPLRVWIFTITANTVRTWIRRAEAQRRAMDAVSAEPPVVEPDSLAITEAREAGVWLDAALHRLPLAQREVVILRCAEHLELGEVAEILEIPENTVKTLLRRARLSLAKAWARRSLKLRREVTP